MRWRVVYVDGSSFDNEDGAPEQAPGIGVAAVCQEDAVVGSAIHHGKDFYVFGEEYGGWCGVDHFGLAQYCGRPGTKVVKLGDNMDAQRYRQLVDSLQRDPLLPKKSARYVWEMP